MTTLANADVVVFDNGVGGAGGVENGRLSDVDINSFLADDFSLGSDETITQVEWIGMYVSNNTPIADDFVVSIHSDAAGLPGGVLATFAVGSSVNRVDSGFNIAAFDLYEFTADVNFAATAGTTYHLSIVNDTSADTNDNWAWGIQVGAGNSSLSDDGTDWGSLGDRNAFQLLAKAVPEPGSATLVLLGFAALIRRKR